VSSKRTITEANAEPMPTVVRSSISHQKLDRGTWGAEAGQFLLRSCDLFSSLFTRVRGRPIGGEVFSLFPVVG
jgi:hypothetical protein